MRKIIILGILATIALFVGLLSFSPLSLVRAGEPQAPVLLGRAMNQDTDEGNFASPYETSVCGSSHAQATAEEVALVQQNNLLREQNGLTDLVISPALERSADTHSLQMASTGYFAHDSYGATLARTQNCGSAATLIAENIAGGYADEASTYNQWLNSPEHKVNMLAANVHFVGIAHEVGIYVDANGTTWQNFSMWTETFADADGNPVNNPTPTPQPTQPAQTLVAHIAGTTQTTIGQVASFTVTGTGASAPYYGILYGDGQSSNWQTSTNFTHTYTTSGVYTVTGYYGDGNGGKVAPVATMTITVGSSTPVPTPTPPTSCQVSVRVNGTPAWVDEPASFCTGAHS